MNLTERKVVLIIMIISMKRSHQDFRRLKQTVSAGFLTAVAAAFLSVPISHIHAGEVPGPPAWYPSEMEAINLYLNGVNQESSDPSGAAKTLLQARQASSAAIREGGGGNTAVLHNDALIARALITAQADAARTPVNNGATENQTSSGQNTHRNNLVRPVGYHLQTTIKVR